MTMYHRIIKGKIREGFRQLSQGNSQGVLSQFAPDAHFIFAGDHALGCDSRDQNTVRQWFQRLFQLFPGIQFEVHTLIVSGWPWDTRAANYFSIHSTRPDGQQYQNRGVQLLRIQWGRIVEDYLYEDTLKLARELDSRSMDSRNVQHKPEQIVEHAL
jgi:ketosteroid isomerase-like protein